MKRHLLSFAAILIAVVGTAFSLEQKASSSRNEENKLAITGTAMYVEVWAYIEGDPLSPTSYERAFWQPSCIGVGAVCCIIAEEDPFNPGRPRITPSLQFEITLALDFCTETNNIKLKFD